MVKRYALLLMLMCGSLYVGAMDILRQQQGYRIMTLAQLKEVLQSPTALTQSTDVIIYSEEDKQGIIVEKDVYEKSEMLKGMIADLEGKIISFVIPDERIFSSHIKQIFDILKVYDSQQLLEEKKELIRQKTHSIVLNDFGKVYKGMRHLLVDEELIRIFQELYRDKIIQCFKNKLVQREAKGPLTLYSHPKGINVVAFSPNDTLIAAGGVASKGSKNFVIKNISAVDWNIFDANTIPTVLEAELASVCVLDFFSDTDIHVGLVGAEGNVVSWSDIFGQNIRSNKSMPVKRPFIIKHIAEKEYFFGSGKENNLLLFGATGIVTKNFSDLARSSLGNINYVAINPTGRLLASVSTGDDKNLSQSKKLFLWNTQTEENKRIIYNTRYSLHPGLRDIHAIAFSPDGNWLIAAGEGSINKKKQDKKNISLFNVYNVWQQKSLDLNVSKQLGDSSKIISTEFSADSKWIVVAGNEQIAIYDVETGNILKRLIDIKENINSVTLSHDCRMLLAGSRDAHKSLLLWELFTQLELHALEQIKHCSDEGLALLYQLCTENTFEWNDYNMNIYNGLDVAIRNFLLSEVPGLSNAIDNYNNSQEDVIAAVSVEEQPIAPVVPEIVPPSEPEGWTWRQRAAIALGFGATAAIVGYQWYQKWNKMKR